MTISRGARRAFVSAITLWAATTYAQGCYYPDGITLSSDVACKSDGTQTSCCPSSAFCLSNGLCFSNNVVSRGSCTDKTWSDPSCASYCRNEHKDESVVLTPCSSSQNNNIFACGLNTTRCATGTNTFNVPGGSGFILRPAQLASLVQPALASASLVAGSSPKFSVTQLAGTAAGVAVPLLIALGITIFLLMRERRRNSRVPKRETQIRDDKGYKTLQTEASPFSTPAPLLQSPSTPGMPNTPGYLSANNPNASHASSGLASPPHMYSTTASPIIGSGQADSFGPSRPSSSRGSARHSIFPAVAQTPAPPAQSPTAGTTPRTLPLPVLNSRESVRSQSTVASGLPSPQQTQGSGFGDRDDAMSTRSPLRVATVQQITIARPPNLQRRESNNESDSAHQPAQQLQRSPPQQHRSPPPPQHSRALSPVQQQQPQQQAAVQNYQRNMAQQYASAMESYMPHSGRAELDSADNRVIRHELGDGRRSWVKE